MKVRDIMSTQVIAVTATTQVSDLARLIIERHITGVPVIDAAGALVGIITEADLIVRNATIHFPSYLSILGELLPIGGDRGFSEELRRYLGATAGDIMTKKVITAKPDLPVQDAAHLMVEKGLTMLPIVENKRVVGIISRTDLVRLLAQPPTQAV